jgi:DNA-binding XRE family transcriptional regulator
MNDFYDDLDTYGEFGFRDDYEEDPNNIMSIFNARKDALIFTDTAPIHKLIKLKRVHDGLNQSQLARRLKMSVGTLSEIERAVRPIPKKRLKDVENWLYHEWIIDGELYYTIEQ